MITAGITSQQIFTVTEENTACRMGSGSARVLATPSLVAMMEQVAHEMCLPYLEEGAATVGTNINLNHLAATPVGMKVTVNATITLAEGRKIEFSLEAFDEKEKIGEASHTRFTVWEEKFQAKCDAKRS